MHVIGQTDRQMMNTRVVADAYNWTDMDRQMMNRNEHESWTDRLMDRHAMSACVVWTVTDNIPIWTMHTITRRNV